MSHYGPRIIFGCSSSQVLARKVCKKLGCKPAKVNFKRHNDGEILPEIKTNVRGADVFVLCSTNPPAENFFELLFLASAIRNSSAQRITLVVPYLGYNRQERKDQSRVPVSAKLVIEVIKIAGADRVLLLDLHSDATAAHFEPMIVDRMYAAYTAEPYLRNVFGHNKFVVASPDAGGVPRARKYRKILKTQGGLAIFNKERPEDGVVDEETVMMVGDVKGKDVLFVDDIVDSGGTTIADASKARDEGAERIVWWSTHGVLSANAVTAIDESGVVDEVVLSDSIYHKPKVFRKAKRTKFTILSMAGQFAEAIRRLHNDEPLSPLFIA